MGCEHIQLLTMVSIMSLIISNFNIMYKMCFEMFEMRIVQFFFVV